MRNKLTEEERKHLIAHHKKERDKRICDRIKSVLLYSNGYTYQKIAEILLLDDETIRRHIKDYFDQDKLAPKNGGSKSYLDKNQSEKLLDHLEKHTYLYVKQIQAYVKNTFNVNYSIRGMTHWLHAKNFCYKRPHGVPAKANQAAQLEFTKAYKKLKNNLSSDEILYFVDSSHPQHQTKLAFGWIKKGVRKPEKTTACQKRLNVIGAINLDNHHIEYQAVDWINAKSIKTFLIQLINHHPDKKTIHLVLDNAGYHKSKEIKEFINSTKIKLHYLPPYSPNLNPIERLWKIMHEQVTCNQYYEKFQDFTEAILGFFENIKKYHSIIQSRITDNFQKLTFVQFAC